MKADYGELKEEMVQMKRRISALERAFDTIATKDDLKALEEARADLKAGRAVSLARTKKSVEV
ncbi:MAG TPA: hypothetical protein VLY21_07805 [Nitrososphaerales archaeon]|nr:hypothetical protein [Nitrososphaerales archaeon]